MERRLPLEKIDSLIALHGTINNRKDGDRIKCVIYWGKGWSWDAIKEALFISDSTIKEYVDRYQLGGVSALLMKRYKSHRYTLTADEEAELCRYVEQSNVLTSAEACDYVDASGFVHNARMDYGKRLKVYIAELLHLPSYSPNLNLIERLWRFAKKKLLANRFYSTFEHFRESVSDFFDSKIHTMKADLKRLMSEAFQTFSNPQPLRI